MVRVACTSWQATHLPPPGQAAATQKQQAALRPPPLPPRRLLRRVLHETAGVRQESLVRLGRMTRSGALLHRASSSSAQGRTLSASSPMARARSAVWGAMARPSRTVGGSQDQHLADGGELTPAQAAAAQLASRQASLVQPLPRSFLSGGLSRLSMVRARRLPQGARASQQARQHHAGQAGLAGLARMSAPPGGACPVPAAANSPAVGSSEAV